MKCIRGGSRTSICTSARTSSWATTAGRTWSISRYASGCGIRTWLASAVCTRVLGSLQQSDLFCYGKHVRRHRADQLSQLGEAAIGEMPWWIGAHRSVAAPLRQLRRRFLTRLGIRGVNGQATSEAFPEDAVRRELRLGAFKPTHG